MSNAIKRVFAALVLLGFFQTSWAAGEDRPQPQPQLQTSGSVRIELIAQPRDIELPSRFYMALRLINSTSEPVIFKSFDLKPLEEPGGLTISDACTNKAQTSVASNTAVTIMCLVHSRGFDDSLLGVLRSLFGSWSLLTLQPGEYRFVATAEVRSDTALMAISTTVPVKIRPTVWQVCLGAALGAALLVVFAFTSPRIQMVVALRERIKNAPRYRVWLIEPLLLWLGATVSASMFIFMTYRLKDVSGPFTITVNDFYGGVVIGLFGVFLADWLAEKLFARSRGKVQ